MAHNVSYRMIESLSSSMPPVKRRKLFHVSNTTRTAGRTDRIFCLPISPLLIPGLQDLSQNGGLQLFISALTIYRQNEAQHLIFQQVPNQSAQHLISGDSVNHCVMTRDNSLTSLNTVATSESPPSGSPPSNSSPNINVVEPLVPASFVNATSIPMTSRASNEGAVFFIPR